MYAEMKKRKNHGYRVKRAVNSMDDCFDWMQEPLYGFRVKITFQRSCNNSKAECNNAGQENDEFQRRQTGEGFRSEAPPDCRIINQCTNQGRH